MADIIPLDEKLELARRKKIVSARRRKIKAVQKLFQCSRCTLKCEKCGAQIQTDRMDRYSQKRQGRIPYHLCGSCSDEYSDYMQRAEGGGDPDCYWHNRNWMESWKSWIHYRESLDRYMKSEEFIQLIEELKQGGPDI